MDSTKPVKCEHGHETCYSLFRNLMLMRDEVVDCTGSLKRYRQLGSTIWLPAPNPERVTASEIREQLSKRGLLNPPAPSPAEAQMHSLADAMDAAKETRVVNAEGGVKADGGKMLPRLLYISLRRTLASMVKVLTIGAAKYSADNWNKVEQERYWDAFYRHITAHHAGEMIDPETGEPHLTHALCCLAFIAEQRAQGKMQ